MRQFNLFNFMINKNKGIQFSYRSIIYSKSHSLYCILSVLFPYIINDHICTVILNEKVEDDP